MEFYWGKMKQHLENGKILRNLSNFIGPSVKIILVFTLFSVNVSCCPLSPVSAATIVPATDASTFQYNSNYVDSLNEAFEEFGESRVFSLGSSSMILASVALQIVRFLVKTLMGDEWLSEEIALRRLDDLKTNLFKYYARRNLFGGARVETARDGIGFPSLEGALLSLAFLTFSVFLIDLIQTVLNKIRLKNAATAAPAPAALMGRMFAEVAQISPTLRENSTNSMNPESMDRLTTLSSKVISAIEKPWWSATP